MVKIHDTKIADIGFYINLNYRTDRRERIETHFKEFNITGVDRFSAFSEYPANTINCKKSHFELYKKLLNTDNEILLVLEDDCVFLEEMKINYKEILTNIYNTDWDLFWLGCRNRTPILEYKNSCYQVASVSHAHSYLIKRNLCEYIIDNFENSIFNQPVTPDELLSLVPYGKEVVNNPSQFDYYNMVYPLDKLDVYFKSLCYSQSLSTQYPSYSDLWSTDINNENYIKQPYEFYKK